MQVLARSSCISYESFVFNTVIEVVLYPFQFFGALLNLFSVLLVPCTVAPTAEEGVQYMHSTASVVCVCPLCRERSNTLSNSDLTETR